MKNLTKLLIVILLMLSLLLAACHNYNAPTVEPQIMQYAAKTLPIEIGRINMVGTINGCALYYGTSSETNNSILVAYNHETDLVETIPVTERLGGLSAVATEGGSLFVLQRTPQMDGETFIGFEMHLLKMSYSGAIISETEIQENISERVVVDFKVLDSVAYILSQTSEVQGGNTEFYLDVIGTERGEIYSTPLLNAPIALLQVSGKIYVQYKSADTLTLSEIGATAKKLTETYALKNISRLYDGNGNDCLYIEGGELLRYDLSSQTSSFVLDFTKLSLVAENVLQVGRVSDDAFSFVVVDVNNPQRTVAVIAEETSSVQTTLILATLGIDQYLATAVADFNDSNSGYHIEIKDYAKDGSESAGLTRLNTEIIAGKSPDLFNLRGLPIDSFEAKGVFADLKPLLGNNVSYVGKLPDLLERNGSLYQAVCGFSISTVIGGSSDFASKFNWTFDDMVAFADKSKGGRRLVFGSASSRTELFDALCNYNMDAFVNWNDKTCNFNSQLFKQILEFCKALPSEKELGYTVQDTPQLITDGMQRLVVLDELFYLANMQLYSAMFGEEISYIGFPNEFGSGSAFNLGLNIAMSAAAEHRDAALEFIKLILSEQFQTEIYGNGTDGFPSNKAAFIALIEKLKIPPYYYDENGEFHGLRTVSQWGQFEIELRAVSENEANEFVKLVNNIGSVYHSDSQITEIISDDVRYYFNGDKTADDVISGIQSRVSLYLGELS